MRLSSFGICLVHPRAQAAKDRPAAVSGGGDRGMPVAMDVVCGYRNATAAVSCLKMKTVSQSGRVFNGALCILAVEWSTRDIL